MATTDLGLIDLTKSYEERGEAPSLEDFLAARRQGVGGSDAGAIAGVDPYRTAADVYREKHGFAVEPHISNHIKRGRGMESIVFGEYIEARPNDVLIHPVPKVTHPDHSWMIGHLDAVITSPTRDGPGVLEVKAPSRASFARIKAEGVPMSWRLQVQHYLAITGYTWGTFAIFCADSWELMLIDVERDDKAIEQLIAVEEDFWKNHVLKYQAPRVESGKPSITLPPLKGEGITERMDPEFVAAVEAYEEAREVEEEAAAAKKAARDRIAKLVQEQPGVYDTLGYRVYNTAQSGRVTTDTKALVARGAADPTKILSRLGLLASTLTDDIGAIADMAAEIARGEHNLDLSEFQKQGAPFTVLRVYPRRTPLTEDDEHGEG